MRITHADILTSESLPSRDQFERSHHAAIMQLLSGGISSFSPSNEGPKQAAVPGENTDTIRGSRDVPLAPQGKQEAERMAQANAGRFDRIESSTLKRARDTAAAISKTNPQAGRVVKNENITPWYLGQHEGQPSAEHADQIADMVKNRPDEVPDGRHAESTKGGQSFNDFKGDVLGDLHDTMKGYRPGERILKTTHGRVVQLIRAHAAVGMPKDGSIDTNLMTSPWLTKPGGMIRVDPHTRTVEDAEVADKPGIYYGRHGATEDNAENQAPTAS